MHSLFNPDYLESLSSKYSLNPSKKYGQNYLIDESVIENIISVSELQKKDTVVEVGPGFGVLTLPLVEKAGEVISFEIEKKLQPYWEEKLKQHKNLKFVWGNVLYELPKIELASGYKVVANLPYQITSAVIRLFLETNPGPEVMVLMVQKEVAERICAKAGDMSLLSVAVQVYADAKMEFVVPRTCFWPSPEVDSAVITLKKKAAQTIDEDFFKVVRAGFAARRKLLVKNLESVIGKRNKERLKSIFSEMHLLPTVRAQELSVEKWKELVSKIKNI